MAIGNKNYVRKNYQHIIEFCLQNFDDLSQLYHETHPTASNLVAFRVELETHISRHTSAAHGVEFYYDKRWSPRSFYGGLAFLSKSEMYQFRRENHAATSV